MPGVCDGLRMGGKRRNSQGRPAFMPLIHGDARSAVAAVAALTECNPFVPERIELMERILGPAKRRNFIDPNSKFQIPSSRTRTQAGAAHCRHLPAPTGVA